MKCHLVLSLWQGEKNWGLRARSRIPNQTSLIQTDLYEVLIEGKGPNLVPGGKQIYRQTDLCLNRKPNRMGCRLIFSLKCQVHKPLREAVWSLATLLPSLDILISANFRHTNAIFFKTTLSNFEWKSTGDLWINVCLGHKSDWMGNGLKSHWTQIMACISFFKSLPERDTWKLSR